MYYKISDYRLIRFQKSKTKFKKYDAILQNRKTNKLYIVPFGQLPYESYRDKTGLNLYPQLLHGDKKRRERYRIRHQKDLKDGYYSPGYFSYFYLW